MKNAGKFLLQFATFMLILLWVYAAFSKLSSFDRFQTEMNKQALWPFLKTALSYALPPTELAIAGLLFFTPTEKIGLICSLMLLILFTSYIALVLMQLFERVPCACGGILRHMGRPFHLIFNLFFLALTITAIIIPKRKEPQ